MVVLLFPGSSHGRQAQEAAGGTLLGGLGLPPLPGLLPEVTASLRPMGKPALPQGVLHWRA